PRGLRDVAEQNLQKTHYAVQQIQARTRHKILFPAPRFNEFVVLLSDPLESREQGFREKQIVPGLRLSRFYPELGNALLVCVTETMPKDRIDALVEALHV